MVSCSCLGTGTGRLSRSRCPRPRRPRGATTPWGAIVGAPAARMVNKNTLFFFLRPGFTSRITDPQQQRESGTDRPTDRHRSPSERSGQGPRPFDRSPTTTSTFPVFGTLPLHGVATMATTVAHQRLHCRGRLAFKSPRPNGRCDGPGRRRRTRHLRRQLLAPSIGHAWSCDARKERSSGQSTHPRATRASDAARAAFVSAPGSSRPRKRPRRGGT